MHVLVTGGGGFLGRYIVEQLLGRGDRVGSFSRQRYPALEALGVECRQGDLRDPAAVREACRDVDTVFHVAALPGIWGPRELFFDINAEGTRNVITACQAEGVTRLIYTSSPSVVHDGQPHENADESLPYPQTYRAHYPHSKAVAEQAVLAANQPGHLLTVALRPHLIWGPRDNHLIPRLIARAKTGRLRRVGSGRNLISVTYVENAAVAHLQAASALVDGSPVGGQAYFINDPEPVNLWNWVNDLLGRAGLPPVTKSISATTARSVGRLLEWVYGGLRLEGEPPMTRFLAAELSEHHYYSIDRAEEDFGYEPLVSMDEGLRRTEPDLRQLAGDPR